MGGYLSGHGGKRDGQPRVSGTSPNQSDPLAVRGEWTVAESSLSGLWDLLLVVCGYLEARLDLCLRPADLPDRAGHQKNHGSEDGVS